MILCIIFAEMLLEFIRKKWHQRYCNGQKVQTSAFADDTTIYTEKIAP